MVLIQSVLERSGTSWARGLLTRVRANSGATHQIIVFVIELIVALLLDTPHHDTENTKNNGTTDTDDNTDDNLIVAVRQTATAG